MDTKKNTPKSSQKNSRNVIGEDPTRVTKKHLDDLRDRVNGLLAMMGLDDSEMIADNRTDELLNIHVEFKSENKLLVLDKDSHYPPEQLRLKLTTLLANVRSKEKRSPGQEEAMERSRKILTTNADKAAPLAWRQGLAEELFEKSDALFFNGQLTGDRIKVILMQKKIPTENQDFKPNVGFTALGTTSTASEGYCDDCRIVLWTFLQCRKRLPKSGQCLSQLFGTLLHEMLHAYWTLCSCRCSSVKESKTTCLDKYLNKILLRGGHGAYWVDSALSMNRTVIELFGDCLKPRPGDEDFLKDPLGVKNTLAFYKKDPEQCLIEEISDLELSEEPALANHPIEPCKYGLSCSGIGKIVDPDSCKLCAS